MRHEQVHGPPISVDGTQSIARVLEAREGAALGEDGEREAQKTPGSDTRWRAVPRRGSPGRRTSRAAGTREGAPARTSTPPGRPFSSPTNSVMCSSPPVEGTGRHCSDGWRSRARGDGEAVNLIEQRIDVRIAAVSRVAARARDVPSLACGSRRRGRSGACTSVRSAISSSERPPRLRAVAQRAIGGWVPRVQPFGRRLTQRGRRRIESAVRSSAARVGVRNRSAAIAARV